MGQWVKSFDEVNAAFLLFQGRRANSGSGDKAQTDLVGGNLIENLAI